MASDMIDLDSMLLCPICNEALGMPVGFIQMHIARAHADTQLGEVVAALLAGMVIIEWEGGEIIGEL